MSLGYWKNLPVIGRITSIQLLLTQSVASVSSNCFLFFFSIFKHCLQSPLVNSFSLSRRNLSCVCPILYPSLLFPAHFLSPRCTGKKEDLWLLCVTLSELHDMAEFASLSVKWIITLARLPQMAVLRLK